MEAPQYDLIVAGAGPAGSACAITAARAGARVLMLEKDHFPRHKVCGEFISPESLGLLEWLLEGDRFRANAAVHGSRLFYRDLSASLPISPSARSVARSELDFELLQAARRAGVQAEEGITIQKIEQSDGFTVAAGSRIFRARAAVNASGRWSLLTQKTPEREPGKEKWIGIKAHFREANPPASVDLYFFDGGYCGVTPMAADTVNACAMVRADIARTLEEVLARHPALERRSREWRPLFSPLTTSGLHFHPPETTAGGLLLAGDAAAFIDPYTGDGISLALQSGTMAARALQPYFAGKGTLQEAQERYRSSYFRHLSRAFRHSAWIRRALTAPPWIRSAVIRLAGIGPIARTLVGGTRARNAEIAGK